jgi:N-acetylneuraminic acid mutarotase
MEARTNATNPTAQLRRAGTPGHARRRPRRRVSAAQRAQFRRRRAGALALLAAVVALVYGIVSLVSSSAPPVRHAASKKKSPVARNRPTPARRRSPTAPPAVVAGLFSWHLPNPIGGEVLVASSTTDQLLLAGGVSAAGSTDSGVYSLLTSNGTLVPLANLPLATQNAAGSMLGGEMIVLGGGQTVPSADSQGFDGTSSSLVGLLPEARADAAAVLVDGTIYLVGGYDGSSLDAEVLATTNGKTFEDVAALPVPVRYPAVAARGSSIYVFGGITAGGVTVDTVQVVDLDTRRARLFGRLPAPLSGAVAVDLSGSIYVAGGLSGSSHAAPTTAVLGFEPARKRFVHAGSLPVAVSDAGGAVTGGELVIVGGQTGGGVLTGDVQFVRQRIARPGDPPR